MIVFLNWVRSFELHLDWIICLYYEFCMFHLNITFCSEFCCQRAKLSTMVQENTFLSFFEQCGFKCPDLKGIADFLLEV